MNTINFGENTQLWLDRLACGEFDELTRKNLFTWLDAEPLRWRSCALALLEAQAWNESLERVGGEPSSETPPASVTVREMNRGSQIFRWASLSSLAAALLVAFTLGALSRGWLATSNSDVVVESTQPATPSPNYVKEAPGPLMATVSLKPELGSQISATLQIPVMAMQNSGAQPSSTPISEYDRQKWERRGYQLTKERRFLPVELPGGKKVVVPVEQVKANYVGSKVS